MLVTIEEFNELNLSKYKVIQKEITRTRNKEYVIVFTSMIPNSKFQQDITVLMNKKKVFVSDILYLYMSEIQATKNIYVRHVANYIQELEKILNYFNKKGYTIVCKDYDALNKKIKLPDKLYIRNFASNSSVHNRTPLESIMFNNFTNHLSFHKKDDENMSLAIPKDKGFIYESRHLLFKIDDDGVINIAAKNENNDSNFNDLLSIFKILKEKNYLP